MTTFCWLSCGEMYPPLVGAHNGVWRRIQQYISDYLLLKCQSQVLELKLPIHPYMYKSIYTIIHLSIVFFVCLFVLFIYFWLCWVFVAVCGLCLVAASGGYSSLRCTCFLLQWLLLLRSTGSRCPGFISCGTQAQ